MATLLCAVTLYSVPMGRHAKKMKSWSTLEGASISVGHNDLLKGSTFT